MNDIEKLLHEELQRVPAVPADIFGAVQVKIHRKQVIRRLVWTMSSVLILLLGLTTYSIRIQQHQADIATTIQDTKTTQQKELFSGGANAELEYAYDFVSGQSIEDELIQTDVVDASVY